MCGLAGAARANPSWRRHASPSLPRRPAGSTLLALVACGEKGPQIDEAGARKIENGIKQQLPLYLADSPGSYTIEIQGGPVAKPAKDHYEVTLPGCWPTWPTAQARSTPACSPPRSPRWRTATTSSRPPCPPP
ncbi:hypothetical protein HHL28_04940 [Aerophototrophica crusticola]|uniref:Uncharacterized protein n=1 Tax=Aerophototrophica crusticola TaxID=1709002 RepID=A0A858R4X6_9PROT|nr:hypothetical protein HHL28_04940 [Rhodospirillaceae bacterium B3]